MPGSEFLVKTSISIIFVIPAWLFGTSLNDGLSEVALIGGALAASIIIWRQGVAPVIRAAARIHDIWQALAGDGEDEPGMMSNVVDLTVRVGHIEGQLSAGEARFDAAERDRALLAEQLGQYRAQLGEDLRAAHTDADALAAAVDSLKSQEGTA